MYLPYELKGGRFSALAKEENLPLPADHFKRGFGKRNELIIPDILNWARDPAEVKRLRAEIVDRTVILMTHRAALLELVDRTIVVDQGRITADGPKATVLRGQAASPGG